MATALQVADYFLSANPPDSITDLKLQKLCAYSQAVSLAYLDSDMFSDPIEMWSLGPVIKSVYNQFKHYEDKPIPATQRDLTLFSMKQRFVLAAVNDYYGITYDAWGLCEQSHRDFPGIRGSNQILTREQLKAAFNNNPLVLQLKRAAA